MDLASAQQKSALRARPSAQRRSSLSRHRRVSLCETLDRVLNKGAVIAGDVIISVADIDLLYLGLNVVVTSIETMRNWDSGRHCARDKGSKTQLGQGPDVSVPNPSSGQQRAEV